MYIVSGVRLIACSSAPGKIMLIKTEGRTHERTPKFQFHLEEKQNISNQFERMYNDNNNAKNASFIWRGLFITLVSQLEVILQLIKVNIPYFNMFIY